MLKSRFYFLVQMILVVMGLSVISNAASAACVERTDRVGEARLELREPGPGRCWMLVGPEYPKTLVYRSYTMDQDGLIMVFNSFGQGPDSETTGAREFYLFPRGKDLDYRLPTDGDQAALVLPSGVELFYDIKTLRFTGASGAVITEAPQIAPDNAGGVEITVKSGLLLDFGFKMGSSPSGARGGHASFVDASGNRCQVRNSDVMVWDQNDDSDLKFKTDAQVYSFVKSRCKNLKF